MSSVLDAPQNSVVAEANNDTPSQPTSADVRAAIVRQVEFYFSDANLPTDKFLLKQVQQGHQGFVPIKLIAQFKRVKSLSKDVDVITEALKGSVDLVVSPDNLYVRRLKPLPNVNEHDIKKRTVLVTQIPGVPSIESVTDLFSRYGAVKLVRICPPGSTEKLPQWLTVANPSVQAAAASSQLFALVELVTEDSARRAVADSGYNGMQVRHLLFDQEQPPSARGHHQHPRQQQPQQDLQHQQHQPSPMANGAGRGSNHRRNASGFQPGMPPPSLDMLRSDVARMQLRSSPSGPMPYLPDPALHHHAPLHHPHQLRAPLNAPPLRGSGSGLPAQDHRRVNQRLAPYTHDPRVRALQTVQALPSYHQPAASPLDGPAGGARPNSANQRMLMVRSQHAPYHTHGPPATPPTNGHMQPQHAPYHTHTAPTTPPANGHLQLQQHLQQQQQQQLRGSDPATGRVRDRPASGRANGTGADKGVDRAGNPDRAVSVGRRAPHFVVDLDYQPAESSRRATSRRQRRNPMDASGSSDTSAANSPMAAAAGAATAAPLVADKKPQQALPPPQQQQQLQVPPQGRGRGGRQAAANGGSGGGSAPLRPQHGGHNPLFSSPAAVGQPHPAMMQQAASRLQGLQTQANGQDLRQFIALFESFVQQQLGTAPGAAPAAAAADAAAVSPMPPTSPVGARGGVPAPTGSAPPISPVQNRTLPYVPIHPATPPASLPGATPPGAKQAHAKKPKNKAPKMLLPDGISTPGEQQQQQQQQQLANGAAHPSAGRTTTPPPLQQQLLAGVNRGPLPQQQQQQQQQQARKGKGAGTPGQGGRGKGSGRDGGAMGQADSGGNENGGAAATGGEGNGAGGNGGEGFGKKRTKKDYATWAAATAEFRAQSAAAYAAGGPEGGPAPAGAGATPPQPAAPGKEAAAVGMPRVPDGTRGFGMGRGRPLAPPVV